MISQGQEPVQETHKECHVPNDDPPNMIVEKNEGKKILWKQQL